MSELPMYWIYVAAALAMLVSMGMILCRAFAGPTTFDRMLAANAMGTKAVIFLALLGFFSGRPEFFDTALAYALVNFASTIAILRFFQLGRVG